MSLPNSGRADSLALKCFLQTKAMRSSFQSTIVRLRAYEVITERIFVTESPLFIRVTDAPWELFSTTLSKAVEIGEAWQAVDYRLTGPDARVHVGRIETPA